MSWYNSQEQQNAHILWSKVRYARNIAALPFLPFADHSADKLDRFSKKLSEIMKVNGFHEHPLQKGACAEALSLAEKQFIDYSFATTTEARSLFFNEPCNLTIFSGGEFHLNIQSLLSGMALSEAHKIASEAEEMLDEELEFAYSDKLGYLASDISLCGSGLELSVCLYLPAARHGSRYGDMKRKVALHGADLSPFLAKYDNAGDLYVLSYIPSPTIDEKKAISNFSWLINDLVNSEISCERIIFANKSTIISDRAWRAFGTLSFATMIDEEELLSLISRIRLSLALDATRADSPPCSLQALNTLTSEGLNGSIALAAGEDCASLDDCRAHRSLEVKKYILPLFASFGASAV